MRLFVAVHLPDPVADAVEDLVDELRSEGGPRVRWTGRPQWHVTLRFLGDVDDPSPVVEALGERLTDGPSSVRARLGPAVGLLGDRVLCVPVGGLDAMAARVAVATAGAGSHVEIRPFRGHLTLARLPEPARSQVAGWVGRPVDVEWSVDEVALVRSHRSGAGVRYETVSTVALG